MQTLPARPKLAAGFGALGPAETWMHKGDKAHFCNSFFLRELPNLAKFLATRAIWPNLAGRTHLECLLATMVNPLAYLLDSRSGELEHAWSSRACAGGLSTPSLFIVKGSPQPQGVTLLLLLILKVLVGFKEAIVDKYRGFPALTVLSCIKHHVLSASSCVDPCIRCLHQGFDRCVKLCQAALIMIGPVSSAVLSCIKLCKPVLNN